MNLRKWFKDSYYSLLQYSGMNALYRYRHRHNVVILTYHSVLPSSPAFNRFDYRNCVTVENFDAQIKLLQRFFKIISLEEAVERMIDKTIDRPYAVITFDDGYRNNYKYALPVLKSNNVSATFYISTAFIGGNDILWTDLITALLIFTKRKSIKIDLEKPYHFNLRTPEEREKASVIIRTYLKNRPVEHLQPTIDLIKAAINDVESLMDRDVERYRFMDWQEVRAMSEEGMEIGSHTHNHILLNMLSDNASRFELSRSKQLIETHTGRPCRSFSYPNGASGNFFSRHYEQLRKMGYHSAVTQISGMNDIRSNRYALNRINITNKVNLSIFKAYLSGKYNKH